MCLTIFSWPRFFKKNQFFGGNTFAPRFKKKMRELKTYGKA